MTQWRCDVCKELIDDVDDAECSDNHGFVHVFDPDKDGGEPGVRSKRVFIKAVHVKCMEDSGYARKTSLMGDVSQWVSYALHLSEKQWVTKELLERLIEYWYLNRGIIVRQL